MSSGDDNQAARDATELLENLSYSDQNVIQMAKANYFKHLLQRLSTGLFFNLHKLSRCISVPLQVLFPLFFFFLKLCMLYERAEIQIFFIYYFLLLRFK